MKKSLLSLHFFYLIAIAIKAFDGIVQVIAAIAIFIMGSTRASTEMSAAVLHLAKRELNADNFLLGALMRWAENLSPHSATLAAIYLLVHGIIKVLLVAALWSKKLWAYPLAIVTLLLFIVFEIERIYFTHSIFLSFAGALDIAIVIFIAREYRTKLKKIRGARP